jgi:hypothetical protein
MRKVTIVCMVLAISLAFVSVVAGDNNAKETPPNPPMTAVCPEGSFLESTAPGAKCTTCADFRAHDRDFACSTYDNDHCCGSYGCGTYIENAVGSSACFKRSMTSSANVVVPSVIGVVLVLCLVLSCVCVDKDARMTPETRATYFQISYLLCTLIQILVLVAITAYPVQLQADYSAVTGTQTVLLTCVPSFVIQVACSVMAIAMFCSRKSLYGYAANLVGCTASLLGLTAFLVFVRHPHNLLPMVGVDGKTITAYFELDSQYQAWGLIGFACLAHGLVWIVCVIRLLIAACAECACPVRLIRVTTDRQANVQEDRYGLLPSAPVVYAAGTGAIKV